VKHIVVPYKSSVGVFAYNHVEAVLQADGRQIECMNVIDRNNEDLKLEYSKIIFAMCKKVGGNRISKRNIKTLLDSIKLPDISHLI
jgi:predicted site-specific integrase-resolvase